MKFIETNLKGAFIVEPEPFEDHRGFFSRTFCRDEFIAHGLNPNIAQCNMSFNHKRATLRGMHYQEAPHEEAKYVICLRGAICDVIIDIRPGSETYCQWVGTELSEENRKMLYVPEGFAHGYQSLTDGATVLYQVSEFYAPDAERGIRWDDPRFNIQWPLADPIVSDRDAGHEDFKQ